MAAASEAAPLEVDLAFLADGAAPLGVIAAV